MKVLANDGISQTGIDSLESSGFKVITTTVAQEQLINYICLKFYKNIILNL